MKQGKYIFWLFLCGSTLSPITTNTSKSPLHYLKENLADVTIVPGKIQFTNAKATRTSKLNYLRGNINLFYKNLHKLESLHKMQLLAIDAKLIRDSSNNKLVRKFYSIHNGKRNKILYCYYEFDHDSKELVTVRLKAGLYLDACFINPKKIILVENFFRRVRLNKNNLPVKFFKRSPILTNLPFRSNLKMPFGFNYLNSIKSRVSPKAFFIGPAGLIETETSLEFSKLLNQEQLAKKVYAKVLEKTLKKLGKWRLKKIDTKKYMNSNKKSACLNFYRNNKGIIENAIICYRRVQIKKRFARLVIISRSQQQSVKSSGLLSWQLNWLENIKPIFSYNNERTK